MKMIEIIEGEIAEERRKAEEAVKEAQAEAERKAEEMRKAEIERREREAREAEERKVEDARRAEEAKRAEEARREKAEREKALRRERLANAYKEFTVAASVLEGLANKLKMSEAERGFILPYTLNRKPIEDALANLRGAASDVMLELRSGQRCTM